MNNDRIGFMSTSNFWCSAGKNHKKTGLLFCWTGSQKKERRTRERLTACVECMCVPDGEGSSTALELRNSMEGHVSDQFP